MSQRIAINPSDYTQSAEIRYSPWGETRYTTPNTTIPTDRKYTGQREESPLGLYYYNARWYDPSIMQFQQPDSLVPDPYNPLDWNRYAYARFNPVKYTDPTGHAVRDPGDDGPDPASPTKLLEWYGPDALLKGRVDLWLNSHPEYNVYADSNVWAENYGYLVPKYEFEELVQSYGVWRTFRDEGSLLIQQMSDMETAFQKGEFQSSSVYFDTADDNISSRDNPSPGIPIMGITSTSEIIRRIYDWVSRGGPVRGFRNDAGDFLLVDQANTRRFRADLNDPYPHQNPHMHLEYKDPNGKWKGFRIYPRDVDPE